VLFGEVNVFKKVSAIRY